MKGGQYRPLSPQGVEEIHETALDILETTGMGYEKGLEETVDDLKAAGCGTDTNEGRFLGDRVLLGTGRAVLHILDLYDRGDDTYSARIGGPW